MKLYLMTLAFALALGTPALLWAQDDDYSFDEFATEGDGEEAATAEDGMESLDKSTAPDASEDEAPADSEEGEEASAGEEGEAAAAEAEQPKPDETQGQPVSDRIKAVSRKDFLRKNRFELSPGFGLSVNDAFFRNYIVQVDATYHITEPFGVELRIGGAFAGEPLEPVAFMRDEFKVLTNLVRPIYMADVSGIFTPLYGKTALFSDWIWHYDMYAAGGLGVTGVSMLGGSRLDIEAIAHQPTLNVGGGMRGFVTRWLVVHVDVRDYIYPSVTEGMSNIQNLLVLSVGAGFYYPLGFEYEYDGYKVNS